MATYDFCVGLIYGDDEEEEEEEDEDGSFGGLLGGSSRGLAGLGGLRNFHRKKATTGGFKGGSCYMQLYDKQGLKGRSKKIQKKSAKLNHGERSLRTVGKCCWRVYA